MKPIDVTRALAIMTRLGIPLAEGLDELGLDDPAFRHLADRLRSGHNLERMVELMPGFDTASRAVLEAVQSCQRPAELLADLSRYQERLDLLRRRLALALFYPRMVLSLAMGSLAVVAGLAWPAFGLTYRLAPLLVIALAGALVVGLWLRSPDLTGLFPDLRRQLEHAEQALWARSLACLLAAEIPLPQALDVAARGLTRVPGLADLGKSVRGGSSLGKASRNRPLHPALAWGCRTTESCPDPARLFWELAEALDAEIDARLELSLRFIPPLSLALVGLASLGVTLAFWWPYVNTSLGF